MKIYKVGGSVRDKILGKLAQDNDYVVVGATVEEMLEQLVKIFLSFFIQKQMKSMLWQERREKQA